MTKPTLRGAISIASNSYNISTGYGQQVKQIADRMVRSGLKVANLSNCGLEGAVSEIRTPYGPIAHYPRGYKPFSDDVIAVWHEHFTAQHSKLPSAVLTLFDVWVYNELHFDGDILAWVPLDHLTLPPKVQQFLMRGNVSPITMSPHGQRQLEAVGIDSTYIPHAIDMQVMKPTKSAFGVPTREHLSVPEGAFLVSMVAANKANGLVHRKAIAENLLAFSLFRQDHPDAYLYLHMEPSNAFGGFNIGALLKRVGLTDEFVRVLNTDVNRIGYPAEALAAFYTASDVLLATNYGEGFGVPVVEAQACGTRVITSSWCATEDLAGEDSWLVAGQEFWDEPQQAWFKVPNVSSIVSALRLAYDADRGVSDGAVKFARQFDADRVWAESWVPYLAKRFPA
jgi:glycosyltransferase involved in cell wall biosynthesis